MSKCSNYNHTTKETPMSVLSLGNLSISVLARNNKLSSLVIIQFYENSRMVLSKAMFV